MGSEVAVQASRYTALSIGTNDGLSRMERIATVMAASGAFKDAKGSAEAFAKLVIGEELGVGPAAAMAQIYLFDGKVTFGASLIASLVKQSGRYKYRVEESDTEVCRIRWFERDESGEWEDVGPSSFTVGEAQAAGLMSKNNWKHYTSDMLFARALTRGARRYCPDVFGGGSVYTPEEVGGSVDGDGNLIIDEQPSPAQANDIPVAPVAAPEPAQDDAKDDAKLAIQRCREVFGKDEADRGIAALLSSHFGGKKFVDLTDDEYGALSAAIHNLVNERERAVEDAEFEEIAGDADVKGHAYEVVGSKGATYEVVVYPDGSWDCSCPARTPDCKHVKQLRRPFLHGDGSASGWLWPGDLGYDNAPPADNDVAAKVERSLAREARAAAGEDEADGSPDPDAGPLVELLELGKANGLSETETLGVLAGAGVGTEAKLSSPSGLLVARGAIATAAKEKRGEGVVVDG